MPEQMAWVVDWLPLYLQILEYESSKARKIKCSIFFYRESVHKGICAKLSVLEENMTKIGQPTQTFEISARGRSVINEFFCVHCGCNFLFSNCAHKNHPIISATPFLVSFISCQFLSTFFFFFLFAWQPFLCLFIAKMRECTLQCSYAYFLHAFLIFFRSGRKWVCQKLQRLSGCVAAIHKFDLSQLAPHTSYIHTYMSHYDFAYAVQSHMYINKWNFIYLAAIKHFCTVCIMVCVHSYIYTSMYGLLYKSLMFTGRHMRQLETRIN